MATDFLSSSSNIIGEAIWYSDNLSNYGV